MKQQVITKRMIRRTLALSTAGRMVDGRARSTRDELGDMDGESGEGSRLFKSLIKDRSVCEPSLPPNRLRGEVWSRQGVPTRNSGSPAARATRPTSEVSLMAVIMGTIARWLSAEGSLALRWVAMKEKIGDRANVERNPGRDAVLKYARSRINDQIGFDKSAEGT
jgi:hypothetical protein